jgi:NADH-quinone oxidoreductase subunit N
MLEQILHSAYLFLPETILAAGFCMAILLDLFDRRGKVVGIFALLAIAVAFWHAVVQSAVPAQAIFSNMYAVDPFGVFFKCLILVAAFFIVIFSMQSGDLNVTEGKTPRKLGEYYALILALTLGMVLMTGATNLLMMYIAIELSSLTSYILSGYTREYADSTEASLKYVIYGALSSGMMLYGFSIIYGLTGALDIYGINHAVTSGVANPMVLMLAGLLAIVGFGYKISAVPFHYWTPDVYEGSPITITAFLSVASKAAGFAMLIRFFKISFMDPTVANIEMGMWSAVQGFNWNDVVAIIAVLTMTLGNLVAIWQNNLKRLLAYSSIAHAGYLLLGVTVMSQLGVTAVMVYFVAYLFMNLGAFYVVMIIADKTGSEDIESYKGIGRRAPVVGASMVILLLSLTGIPPTAGFIGKLFIFSALLQQKIFWLAIIAALNSVVSLYYYVRILRNMYLRGDDDDTQPELVFSVPQIVVLMLFVVPTLGLGLYFKPLLEIAQASVTIFYPH